MQIYISYRQSYICLFKMIFFDFSRKLTTHLYLTIVINSVIQQEQKNKELYIELLRDFILNSKNICVLSPYPIPDPIPLPLPDNKIESLIISIGCIFPQKQALDLKDQLNIVNFTVKYNTDLLVIKMNDIERLKHHLLFIARLSVNYHSKAERFYLNVANIATYLAIILSAGSITALSELGTTSTNLKAIGAIFALIVLIVNAAILAYGVPQKANIHAGFRTQWIKLLGNIQKIETSNKENYILLKSLEADSFLMHEQEPVIVKRWQLDADRLTRINMGLPQHI